VRYIIKLCQIVGKSVLKWQKILKSDAFYLGKEAIMFYGQYSHNMDQKGRITMPAKFRDELGDRFIVSRGTNGCLYVFPMEIWKKIEDKITSASISTGRVPARAILPLAIDVEPDKQGRILISQELRDYAKLTKEVTVIGTGNIAEIWNADSWNEYLESIDESKILDAMAEIGI
jgi:MraZ protein